MPTPYEETGWAPIGHPQSPIVAAREAQQAEPPDPSEFFHVGPGMVPADHPEYKQDRDLWWQHFVSGFYQQNFRNVNDYIEYVGSLGDHPAINAFAKKQAEKFMPPKLKEELEQMKAEKKKRKAFDDDFETAQRLNKDPRLRLLNQVAELDPKGGIKFTELKIDPELQPYYEQIKMARENIDMLQAKEKGEGSELDGTDTAYIKEQWAIIRNAQRQTSGIQMMRNQGFNQLDTEILGGRFKGERTPEAEQNRDYEAMKWAQKNPNDPRAQQIMALQGSQ